VASIASYQQTSPIRNHALARLAAVNATQKLADYSAAAAAMSGNYDDSVTILGSGPLTSGPFSTSPETIVIEDDATPVSYGARGMRESRKRHRSSVESNLLVQDPLQGQVRMLMRQALPEGWKRGWEKTPTNELIKPAAKKACYMTEIKGREGFVRPEGGPGMWRDLLG
jgi:hypothetical protein